MDRTSRSLNSINNAAVSIGSALITFALHFIMRTVFIRTLAAEYLGLGGLFSNILSFLSLAELGVAHAINFALYKPLRNGDTEKINSLMKLYRRFYNVIGVVILVLGFSLAPFLQFLIKDMPEDIPNIRLYYMMYVFNSASSYFFTYKRSLIVCDQKEYISTIEMLCVSIITTIVRIVLLLRTHDYFLFLLVSMIATLIGNVSISFIAGRMYPFIRDKDAAELDPEEKKRIWSDIRALIFHKIGTVVVFSTDNLIISRYVGLVGVGLYSNYTMIINGVRKLIIRLIVSSTASVGNLIASGDKERCHEVMYHMIFACVWLYGFSAICFFCLLPNFIVLWIGERYLLSAGTLAAAVASFYITGMRQIVMVFKEAAGIFRPDRYKSIVESIANIAFSIPLAIKFGIAGVILGTILSTVLVCFLVESYVFFRNFFGGGTRRYLLFQLRYALFNLLLCGATYLICSLIRGMGIAPFIGRFLICMVFPNAVYYLLFRRTAHFAYFLGILKKILKRIK